MLLHQLGYLLDYCFARLMLVMMYILRNKLLYCVCIELAVQHCSYLS